MHREDLKSVVSVLHPVMNINEAITFRLMKRQRGSFVAYPVNEHLEKEINVPFLKMSNSYVQDTYCKLLLAERTDVASIINRERQELNVLLAQDEDSAEKCFVESALELLNERQELLQQENDLHLDNCALGSTVHNSANGTSEFGTSESTSYNTGQKTHVFVKDSVDTSQETYIKYFYFYQALDGQHIYLDPINARMLEHTYGSLEFAPTIITGNIVEKEGGSMTNELRGRLRYLQHLPVTCQFEVAEITLSESIVSKETMNYFKDQLMMRKKTRLKKDLEEKRREKKIQEQENRKLGKYPEADIHLDSLQQFPEVGFEYPQLSKRTESESTCSSSSPASMDPEAATPSSSFSECSVIGGNEHGVCSFAKMVSMSKMSADSWPGLNAIKTVCTKSRSSNVTGEKGAIIGIYNIIYNNNNIHNIYIYNI